MAWYFEVSSVSIELDCKQVVDGISNNLSTNSIFGAIMNTCKVSLMNHQNFKISFITRRANNVTHLLVKATLSYASSQVPDYMPSCIKTTVINEMS